MGSAFGHRINSPMSGEPARFGIRRATRRDSGAIEAIDAAVFAPEDQYRPEFYESLWTGTAFETYVACEAGGRILGYVLLDRSSVPVQLYSIAVRTECQRLGIGEALLRFAEQLVAGELRLWVRPENLAARRLYDRLGFTVVPEAAGDDGQIVMRLRQTRRR
jgi:ribosomal protein S18 acetylase RimI-like enzyme